MVPLVSLIDDHNIATRNYTLKTLHFIGPLRYDQLKTLAPAVLSRLDDPGSEIREKAAVVIGKLELTAVDEDSSDLWETLLKQILGTLLIHLESPEINLRERLIESLRNLSSKHPEVYRAALDESTIPPDLKRKLP